MSKEDCGLLIVPDFCCSVEIRDVGGGGEVTNTLWRIHNPPTKHGSYVRFVISVFLLILYGFRFLPYLITKGLKLENTRRFSLSK